MIPCYREHIAHSKGSKLRTNDRKTARKFLQNKETQVTHSLQSLLPFCTWLQPSPGRLSSPLVRRRPFCYPHVPEMAGRRTKSWRTEIIFLDNL